MDNDILEKFKEQGERLDKIYVSVEKTRKYFLWTLIATVVMFVLPLVALAFVIPWFLNILTSAYGAGM